MTIQMIIPFLVTTMISLLLVPFIMAAGSKLKIIAKKNSRTIHNKEMVRIGGYAIYLASIIGIAVFLKTDSQINSILIGSLLIFIVGLYDDIHNLSAKVKLIGEIAAAMIVIIGGNIYLKGFDFLPTNISAIISLIITIFWIVGITNAINLIDGLDGLSAGVSVIVLFTIAMTSLASGRSDIASLALIVAGAVFGFLFYNFYPAKLFMGDSGALFIGFMISVISLLGFGYSASAFFTLGAPFVVLMVPILDTLVAIIRRKLHHKKFSDADRNHLHHNLMFKMKLGQRRSVLILYLATFIFSISSYLFYVNQTLGTILFILMLLIFEVFVEATQMISVHYCFVLATINIFINSDKLPRFRFLSRYLQNRSHRRRILDNTIIILLAVSILGGIYYFNFYQPQQQETITATKIPYTDSSSLKICHDLYLTIVSQYNDDDKSALAQSIAAYFVCDFFSFQDKKAGEIGGLDYIYPSKLESLKSYASTSYYQNYQKYPTLAVADYQVISFSSTAIIVSSISNAKYYSVIIAFSYNQEVTNLPTNATVTIIYVKKQYYVFGIDVA